MRLKNGRWWATFLREWFDPWLDLVMGTLAVLALLQVAQHGLSPLHLLVFIGTGGYALSRLLWGPTFGPHSNSRSER